MPEFDSLYSPSAESAILGSAMVDPEIIREIDLAPGDFYLRRNGTIWEAMLAITRRGGTVDYITLGSELDARGQLAEVGGPGYLAGMIADIPLSHHPEETVKVIRDLATRRVVVRIAMDLATAANAKDKPLDGALARIMTSLGAAATSQRGAVPWSFHLSKADTVVKDRSENPTSIWGMRTGFVDFDNATGGLQKSELLIVSGEPGVGKSFWVLQLAMEVAKEHPGSIYSLEMTGEAVAMRALSIKSGVRTRVMKSGMDDGDDWPAYFTALQELSNLPIYMSDETGWTTTALRADLARLKQARGIEWFVVDYSYLLADGEGRVNETEKTGMISVAMKNICKNLNLAGVLIHSMNKAIMGSANQAQQVGLRGSAQVAYDADVTLFLTRPDDKNDRLVRCTFGKGRELEKPRIYFDLQRLEGSAKYVSVVAKKHDLREYNDYVK